MINRRTLLFVPLAVVMALAPLPARAITATGAVAHVEALTDQAITTLQRSDLTMEQREVVFRRILRQGFGVDFIGRFVLGRAWAKATPEQQADYLALFGEFLVKTSAKRLGGFSGETLTVVGTKESSQDVIVQTRLDRPGASPVAVGWRVRLIDDEPKIIDVTVAGLSLALTQRDEFASVTRKQGVDGLLQVLLARTDRLTVAAR